MALGAREQISFRDEPVLSAVANPYAADQLLFRMDQNGNENMQIYLQDLSAGRARLLTDGRSLHGMPVWANDGRRIAFTGSGRDGASHDIYMVDVANATGSPQLVFGGGSDTLQVQDWSLDDSKLLLLRQRSATDGELVIVDIATGKVQPIEPAAGAKGPFAVRQGRFSRDGRGVYYLTDHGGEFVELRYSDMFTGETLVLAPQTRWNVERFALSRDGRFIAYTLNEAGYSRLVLHDIRQQADILLPALPAGAVIGALGFDPKGQRLALQVESAQSPPDVYVLEAGAAPGPELMRWTASELGPLDRSRLVAPEQIEFPTWDRVVNRQRTIPVFIYRPRSAGPHPVLIALHGGPEAQARPTWDAFTQYLVNELGYAVVMPNVRGSSGYGRSFLSLDDQLLREDAVRDVGSLLVWIGLQGELDRNRVVVMGESYGGYMALASLAHYGDRLAGGIDVAGISNFVTFLESTSPWRRDLRRAEFGDERTPAMRSFLQRISPLSNTVAIQKPVLVVQGLNDPSVRPSESVQLVQQLRLKGVDVGYLAAKDEGRGFGKKGNRDAFLAAVANFLEKRRR
jgi:dipeptidyl aminopeptidase/acylaminoacyl peptidase